MTHLISRRVSECCSSQCHIRVYPVHATVHVRRSRVIMPNLRQNVHPLPTICQTPEQNYSEKVVRFSLPAAVSNGHSTQYFWQKFAHKLNILNSAPYLTQYFPDKDIHGIALWPRDRESVTGYFGGGELSLVGGLWTVAPRPMHRMDEIEVVSFILMLRRTQWSFVGSNAYMEDFLNKGKNKIKSYNTWHMAVPESVSSIHKHNRGI